MKNNHILSKNMIYIVEDYSFVFLTIVKKMKDIIEKIVSSIYISNIQIRRVENLSTF